MVKLIILPDSVEKIGVSAFENCSKLEKVIIGEQSELESIASATFKNDTDRPKFALSAKREITLALIEIMRDACGG